MANNFVCGKFNAIFMRQSSHAITFHALIEFLINYKEFEKCIKCIFPMAFTDYMKSYWLKDKRKWQTSNIFLWLNYEYQKYAWKRYKHTVLYIYTWLKFVKFVWTHRGRWCINRNKYTYQEQEFREVWAELILQYLQQECGKSSGK